MLVYLTMLCKKKLVLLGRPADFNVEMYDLQYELILTEE